VIDHYSGTATVRRLPNLENNDESACLGQENLPKLQNHSPRPRGPGNLQGCPPQTAAGIKPIIHY